MIHVKAAKLLGIPQNIRAVDHLQSVTLRYWQVSSVAKGRVQGQKTNVGACIDACRDLKGCIGPTRPLQSAVSAFSDTIVTGKFKKRNSPATVHVLSLSSNTA